MIFSRQLIRRRPAPIFTINANFLIDKIKLLQIKNAGCWIVIAYWYMQEITTYLKDILRKIISEEVQTVETHSIGGGSVNDSYRLLVNGTHYFFLKVNIAAAYPGLFEKEKEGLDYLRSQQCIAVPDALFCGVRDKYQLLLLQWIPAGTRTDSFWKKFGEQLALLHHSQHDQHGFTSNNYMGALPQENDFTGQWTDFFFRHRLLPQINLAIQKNLLPASYADIFQQLGKKLDAIFAIEPPSLLHGDLWSGNFMCNKSSLPVLVDPAVYYGHRSMDLGMTTLFGGFGRLFYDAYHYHFPLPVNYQEQWEICNLYPLLIHLNLFGQSYLGEIVSTLVKYE